MRDFIKDAPCLCKDDDVEIMPPKRNFFQRIMYNRLRERKWYYEYPVLYSDGVITNAKCERIGRKPLGIIFENHLITLKDSPDHVNWYEAREYCKKIKIFGQSCDAGTLNFWEKYKMYQKELNTLLKSVGGKSLNSHKRYWASSEYSNYRAWVFCTSGSGGVDYNLKDSNNSSNVVRPVLDFNNLPPEVVEKFVWHLISGI